MFFFFICAGIRIFGEEHRLDLWMELASRSSTTEVWEFAIFNIPIVRRIDVLIVYNEAFIDFPFFTLETGNSSILREWTKENLIAFVQRKWGKLDCSQKRSFILLLSRIFYLFWLELAWGKRMLLDEYI